MERDEGMKSWITEMTEICCFTRGGGQMCSYGAQKMRKMTP